jgi:hypothetical protein
MRYPIYIVLLLVAVFLVGPMVTVPAMGTTQNQQAALPQHGMAGMSMMQNCPMQVPGADISVVDTNDGIALTITGQSGDVADLRRRAEGMVRMHSNDGMHGNMMPFSVTYEEIPNGARLTLKPKDPGKLEEFRKTVRQHAEEMKNHDCSMMQGMMGGMKNSEPAANPGKPKTDDSDHSAHHPGGQK